MKNPFFLISLVLFAVVLILSGLYANVLLMVNASTIRSTTPPAIAQASTAAPKPTQPALPAAQPTVTGTILFRVMAPGSKPIGHARVILVDNKGNVIISGLSDSTGQWTTPAITVPTDPRFLQKLGTITAIAVADGYNEKVEFELPVADQTVQPIVLEPFKSGERNEPGFELGNIHRLMVFDLLDKAAKQLGLAQQQSPNGVDNPHWSSNLR